MARVDRARAPTPPEWNEDALSTRASRVVSAAASGTIKPVSLRRWHFFHLKSLNTPRPPFYQSLSDGMSVGI